jgi:hypothetical protein
MKKQILASILSFATVIATQTANAGGADALDITGMVTSAVSVHNQALIIPMLSSFGIAACMDKNATGENAEKNGQTFGTCLLQPVLSSGGTVDGLSSKEKQARIVALKSEVVKAIAGETEIHPVVSAMINTTQEASGGQLNSQEAAAQVFQFLMHAESQIVFVKK